jgi:hypothetical protein
MATFRTYAEILTPDHVQWVGYKAGIRKSPPGIPLKEILDKNGGAYEMKMTLSDEFRQQVRRVAELSGDKELTELAGRTEVTISLEDLRHVDPQTRIVTGITLDYTAEESERLGLNAHKPFDPANTISVTLDPENPLRVKRS